MNDRLRGFFQQLLQQAINSGIHTIFWKMPFGVSLVVLVLLVAIALYFQLY